VRLPRTLVSAELAAAGGDLVVTGPPGSGKTALLRELAVTLRERGEEVVLLAAEALPGRAGQARSDLGLENDLTAALTGWTASSSGTLILDGLDAMRGEEGSRWLRDLVSALESTRWRVVVSIRQFDLHHSLAWQRVLRGTPVSTAAQRRDPRLAGVRHLLVGDLTDGELAALPTQSAQLAGLLHEASPRLRELLRNPFNLSLAADLLTSGQNPASLARLRSQLELLRRYWDIRVTQGNDGHQRVRVLTTVTTTMIQRRRLQIDAAGGLDAAEFGVVEALLRDGVLREAAHRLLASGGSSVCSPRLVRLRGRGPAAWR
jgi:energy-coupling factor transporter ATP-binding protein EcfA2